ncbi:MAG: hypothetical protein U5J97_02105 [Trueperaceae bacterium]|nr:hypothetical protein [Trueperaceae bacterium]
MKAELQRFDVREARFDGRHLREVGGRITRDDVDGLTLEIEVAVRVGHGDRVGAGFDVPLHS